MRELSPAKGVNRVLVRTLRIIFGVLGILTGYTITKTIVLTLIPYKELYIVIPIYGLLCCICGIALFYISGKTFNFFNKIFGNAEQTVLRVSLHELIIACAGLIIGLIIANLLSIPFRSIDIIGGPIAVVLNILLGIGGAYFAIAKKEEISFGNLKSHTEASKGKLIDSCVIIDGRIIDIIKSGFLEGPFVVPHFIIKELQLLADKEDDNKRNRGKRGLEILEKLKNEVNQVEIAETEFDNQPLEVDVKLLKYSEQTNSMIITLDYNLNKVAAITGINVLNINDLANSVKRITLPGETLTINITKQGKENGQGIGYLEDGTMVIVEDGKQYIGFDKTVIITSIVQTSAGRLVFSKLSE